MSKRGAKPAVHDVPSIDFHHGSRQATGNATHHPDAANMRRRFSIPGYDRASYDYATVWPNVLEHHWEGPPTGASQRKGGTDFLVTEKPGRGKSTLLLNVAARLMEINDEAVVWRGSQSRAEWTPFAPWARLCLPSSCRETATARLDPSDPSGESVDVPLEAVARDIVWYDDPVDLNHRLLEPGRFHVVFPDPTMRECQAIYEASEHDQDGVEFASSDPTRHWWYAYLLARVERGPHHWTAVFLDEVENIAPESASDDAYATRPKIELVTGAWVDFRRFGVSLFAAGHSAPRVHHLWRHKISWRISMWGSGNPTSASEVVGFDSVPMNTNLTSGYDFGQFLAYTEDHFERKLEWSELPDVFDRELKISLRGGSP